MLQPIWCDFCLYRCPMVQRPLPTIFHSLVRSPVKVHILGEMIEIVQRTGEPAPNKVATFIGWHSVCTASFKLSSVTAALCGIANKIALNRSGSIYFIERIGIAISYLLAERI